MRKLVAFAIGCAALVMSGGAGAQSHSAPPPAAKTVFSTLDPNKISDLIVNDPSGPNVTGARARLVDDERVQGGKALRIQVSGKGKNPWDASVTTPVTKAIKAGDRLLLAFWARLEKGEKGATSSDLPYNAVQMAQSPWTSLFGGPVSLTSEWKLLEVQGTANKDYPAGSLNTTMQLATAKQTIDLGPVILLNLGQ